MASRQRIYKQGKRLAKTPIEHSASSTQVYWTLDGQPYGGSFKHGGIVKFNREDYPVPEGYFENLLQERDRRAKDLNPKKGQNREPRATPYTSGR